MKNSIINGVLFLILGMFPMLIANGRGQNNTDSMKVALQQKIKAGKQDSNLVKLYLQYGGMFENNLPDSANYYYEKALQLANKINYQAGKAAYISYKIVLLNNKGAFGKAIRLSQKSLLIYQQLKRPTDEAIVYNNIGSGYQSLGNLKLASQNYIQAAKTIQQKKRKTHKDSMLLCVLNNNIGSVFIELKDFRKAENYARQAIQYARILNDLPHLGSAFINLSLCLQQNGQPTQSLKLLDSVGQIGKSLRDYTYVLDAALNKGNILNKMNLPQKAEKQFIQVLKQGKKYENPVYEFYGRQGLAESEYNLHQLNAAYRESAKALQLGKSLGAGEELLPIMELQANIREKQRRYSDALSLRKEYETMKDSVAGEKLNSNIHALEIIYQSKEKENQLKARDIQLLQSRANLREKRILIYALGGVCLFLLITGFLSWRNFQHRHQLIRQEEVLQARKIANLEKERRLVAAGALLQGQEQERTRLARDLHDGIGGLLSGVKLSLSNMKGNVFISESNALAVGTIISQLDQCISELRRVSHNMMPEGLIRYGLLEALDNYCENINQSGALTVSLQAYGMEEQMEQNCEIIIYRMVQELLNNIVKHAEATKALIQISRQGDRFQLTVEDNGKGFDMDVLQGKNEGAGMDSLKIRAAYLNGSIDIHSKPGDGTSITIEGICESQKSEQ